MNANQHLPVAALRRRVSQLLAALLLLANLNLPSAFAAEPGASLADSLVELKFDEAIWDRWGIFALGLQLGIPEEKLHRAWPGLKVDALPRPVFDAIRAGGDSLDPWIACLDDERPSGVSKDDLFGGGSSKKAPQLTVSELAESMLLALVPFEPIELGPASEPAKPAQLARDRAARLKLIKKRAPEWSKQVAKLPADERLALWFKQEGAGGRRALLALAIQMEHAPAYPLLEADFVRRAEKPDNFLLLELMAYVRHRRSASAPLLAKLGRRELAEPDVHNVVMQIFDLLTKYDKLEPAIDDYLAGKLEWTKLATLVERSVDQPWAYHSMPIEPVSVFRPTMETNLKALVASAQKQQQLKPRLQLMILAEQAASTLATIIGRTSDVERMPRPDAASPDWKPTIEHLQAMFPDERMMVTDEQRVDLQSPSDLACDIVWKFLGPAAGGLDVDKPNVNDWRDRNLAFFDGAHRSLLVEAARAALDKSTDEEASSFPEQAMLTLARSLQDGTAAQWRKQLSTLTWEQRLLLDTAIYKDREFGERIWPRLGEFVEWRPGDQDQSPETFAAVWRDKLVGKRLDATTWQVLKDWATVEARAGRYWWIVGESYPVHPGLSVVVLRTPPELADGKAPTLTAEFARSSELRSEPEYARILPNKVERLPAPPDKFSSGEKRLTPLEALDQENKRKPQEKDFPRSGFAISIRAQPPGK